VFDIGFSELLFCLVVALVVIGPERLPETVRSVSLWVGRLKRSLRETRSEIERQIGADDIRRQLHNEEIMERIEKTRLEMETTYNNILNDTQAALNGDPQPAISYEHQELPDHAHGPELNGPALEVSTPPPEQISATELTITSEPADTSAAPNTTESVKPGQA
jgi:sec-independent protein translocase protein TatB